MDSNFKVLVLDDEELIREFLVDEFNIVGFEVFSGSSGQEGVELLKKNTFDAVVSDFRMPNGNGLFVMEYIQTLRIRPALFFISADPSLVGDSNAKNNVTKFFPKPFDIDEIIKELNSIKNTKSS